VIKMKRVLVTGGAGFVGRHLVQALAAAGHSVSVLDNLHRGRHSPDIPDFIHGDIRDYQTVWQACLGVHTVFHLAAESRVLPAEKNPQYCHSTNIDGTRVLLEACRNTGVRRFVFASSREVYGNVTALPVSEDAPCHPQNLYGQSKLLGERQCLNFEGVDVIILRLSNIYGPGDHGRVIPRFIQAAIAGDPCVVFGASKVLDFLWIDDAVGAIVRAAELAPSGSVLNIGSGRGVGLPAIAQLLIGLCGGISPIVIQSGDPLEVLSYIADIRRARSAIGLMPKLDCYYGLEEMVAEARAAKDDARRTLLVPAVAGAGCFLQRGRV